MFSRYTALHKFEEHSVVYLLCLILNAMNTSQGKLNLHFSYISYEGNIHAALVHNINISESYIYFARKVISSQYDKRLLCLGVHLQLEKLIMYLECFIYLMFMCVCMRVYVAVHEWCIANLQKPVFDFYHIVSVSWIYVRVDSKCLKLLSFIMGPVVILLSTLPKFLREWQFYWQREL